MSKKLKNVKWESVSLVGLPISMSDKFQGFVGLEECSDYGLEKEPKKYNKQKQRNKRKIEDKEPSITKKKTKLNNGRTKATQIVNHGFIVEPCVNAIPSCSNDIVCKANKNGIKKNKKTSFAVENRNVNHTSKIINGCKTKLFEKSQSSLDSTPEDMFAWVEYKLQEPIMNALMELGFKSPTKIQELTLPAAIHGRRDILGAAETGSGKTLAFGLPILAGILRLKENAALGLDVYDLPYKKTSVKKASFRSPNLNIKKSKIKNRQSISTKSKKSYSFESSCVGNESDLMNVAICKHKIKKRMNEKMRDNKGEGSDDGSDFEDYDVPLNRKTVIDVTASTDSDDIKQLSGTIDSDDLAQTSDEDQSEDGESSENYEHSEYLKNNEDDDTVENSEDDYVTSDYFEEEDSTNYNETDLDLNKTIRCVKVVHDVDMKIPRHVVMKTGKPLYALILTPTRELAIQISRHLIAVAKYTGIKVATIVGGMAAVKQERVLRSGPEIVVATPGRLWELITQGQPHLQQLDTVKFLAIDETDRMVERGHFEELHPILDRLNADATRSGTRQNFVFSATLTMVHDLPAHMRGKTVTKRGKILNRKIEKMTPQLKIKRLVDMIGMTDPKVVDITTENFGTAETLTESRITCSMEQKDVYLYYILLRHPGRTIVFCNSIVSVKRLAQRFKMLKCRPLPLHASMQQRDRLKNLDSFRDDPHGVLIATDVAARGLDIPNVDHVIHYQVPRTAESYVHRSGRTARANKEGLTILMIEPSEALLYGKLCRTLNKTTELPPFPVAEQCLHSLREAVTLARSLDMLALRRRRIALSAGWREKAAKEMDIIIDDDVLPVSEAESSLDKEYNDKKRHLDALLSRPLGFLFKYPTLNNSGNLAGTEENALQAMKKALKSGELKREKRRTKNEPLLKLQKYTSPKLQKKK